MASWKSPQGIYVLWENLFEEIFHWKKKLVNKLLETSQLQIFPINHLDSLSREEKVDFNFFTARPSSAGRMRTITRGLTITNAWYLKTSVIRSSRHVSFSTCSIKNLVSMTINHLSVTTFYLPLIFILVLYWRIYQAARKRINKRKTDSPNDRRRKSSEAPKKISAAKFRYKNRNKLPKEDWDSQNSEAVSFFCFWLMWERFIT